MIQPQKNFTPLPVEYCKHHHNQGSVSSNIFLLAVGHDPCMTKSARAGLVMLGMTKPARADLVMELGDHDT